MLTTAKDINKVFVKSVLQITIYKKEFALNVNRKTVPFVINKVSVNNVPLDTFLTIKQRNAKSVAITV
jgi:hypothetical protein